ncbi:MAG: hypothetical protein UT48_C0010G0051 [Parcubacteria group bacterium GW2011_GWE2_39_37]|uniref:Uncharacterized protein n=1 Tax=Candidatus Falkowbacteria bacterium GW2011_GWF2_39_8 TaxID=1618642 RepID=A0A0G0PZL6_9BACT|nr:MAG: hypothetical protein UT48_C0010G0051 [Parcubacteria group bacterium GW2011_GWE2_39_37]KKR33348.1 MAG: hypothetical protein UT64_C0010G0022 [Candidatus Falkowbacteria bacterium GW2011_GWF2_39_8]
MNKEGLYRHEPIEGGEGKGVLPGHEKELITSSAELSKFLASPDISNPARFGQKTVAFYKALIPEQIENISNALNEVGSTFHAAAVEAAFDGEDELISIFEDIKDLSSAEERKPFLKILESLFS